MHNNKRVRNKEIIQAVAKAAEVKGSSVVLLNPGAPNSWTLHDKENGLVWKVVKQSLKRKKNFEAELEILEQLDENQYVVKHISVGKITVAKQNLDYLIFPYIEGNTLWDLLNSRKEFSSAEVINIVEQLVKAVEYLKSNDIVHHDIKPANIILTEDGEVRLLDLGIALFESKKITNDIKNGRGPYAYLSPEKWRYLVHADSLNMRMISFASDLFSIGGVAYELTTGVKLASRISIRDLTDISDSLEQAPHNISTELSSLIGVLLHVNPTNRINGTSAEYGIAWFPEPCVLDTPLWLQLYNVGYPAIRECIEEIELETNWGMLFAGDVWGNDSKFESEALFIKEQGGKLMFDPATYRLQYPAEHHGYLKYRNYYSYGSISPEIFLNSRLEKKGEEVIKEVIDFQKKLKCDYYIPPYFCIEKIGDIWTEVNFRTFEKTKKLLENSGETDKPLFFGTVLSQRLILNKNELRTFVTLLLSNSEIENIFLILESTRESSNKNNNLEYLKNVSELIEVLSKHKNIFLAQADIEALGYLGKGLAAFSITPDFRGRKTSVHEKFTKPAATGGTQPNARYFAQQLWNDILASNELDDSGAKKLGSDRVLSCGCRYCTEKGRDVRGDRDNNNKHFILNIDAQTKKIQDNPAGNVFESMLVNAKKNYEFLENKCKLKFDKTTNGDFIPVWIEAFK
jgi:hypothetical protein